MTDKVEMVRHILASIAYRFQTAIGEAPDNYSSYEVGSGVRTPNEIIRHMTHVLKFVHRHFDREADTTAPESLSFAEEITRFHRQLERLDQDFLALESNEMENLKKLVQGPLSDVMTHIGQLAMIRRIAGSPVKGQNFYAAKIEAGQVGKEQSKPLKPFE